MCAIGTLHRFTERLLSWIKNIRIKIWIQRSLHHIILFAWREDYELKGQQIHYSAISAHHQNGIAERAIRTVIGSA